MSAWLSHLGAFWLAASLAATVFLLIAAIGMVLCRQPARRCALARATLTGSVLIPLLVGLGPQFRVHPPGEVGPVVTIHAAPWGGRASDDRGRMAPLGPSVPLPLVLAGLGLYGVGLGIGLGSLLLGWWGSGWLVRHTSEPSAATQRRYDALPFGGRRRPRLRLSSRVRHAVLLGVVRPTILIPLAMDRAGAEDALRLSLLHELAHAERGDSRFGWLAGLARVLWFHLPPTWWIVRQMRLDQEFLADRQAVARFGCSGAYAESLIGLAAAPGGAHDDPIHPPAPATRGGTGSVLYQRVLMLLRCPFAIETRAPLWWRGSLALILAGGLVLTSGLTPRGGALLGGESAIVSPPSPGTRQFQISELALAARPPDPQGRAPMFELPLIPPDTFELTFDVWTRASDLARMSVAGYQLGPLATAKARTESWYQVRFQRNPHDVALWINGQPLPLRPDPEATLASATRLVLKPPPHRDVVFRNLTLAW